jgi:hypothetical protein
VIYTKENLTKQVRFRENKERSSWDTRTTDPDVQVPLVIEELDPEKHYLFQVLWYAEGKIQITDGGEGTETTVYRLKIVLPQST